MMIRSWEAVAGVVMIALTVWQWRQVRRHPGDIALKALAVGTTTIAFVLTMSVADVPQTAAIHAVLDAISFSNIAWTLLFYIYSIFFLLATMQDRERDAGRIRRRAAVEFGVYLLFLVPGLLALLTAEPGFFGRDRDPESHLTLRNAVYYVGVSLYPLLAWVVGTVRAVAYLRLLDHRGARTAVLGVVTALGLMTLGVNGVSLVRQGLYIAFPGSTWPLMRDLYNLGRISGQILLVLSLASVPLTTALAGLRERRERRRRQRYAGSLEPLWRRIVDEFPHVALPASASSTRAETPDLDRMMIEVSDGLAYLAEWSTARLPTDATVADRVADALAAKRRADDASWAGAGPTPDEGDLPQWEPDFARHDWEARARWMVDLSQRLRRDARVGVTT